VSKHQGNIGNGSTIYLNLIKTCARTVGFDSDIFWNLAVRALAHQVVLIKWCMRWRGHLRCQEGIFGHSISLWISYADHRATAYIPINRASAYTGPLRTYHLILSEKLGRSQGRETHPVSGGVQKVVLGHGWTLRMAPAIVGAAVQYKSTVSNRANLRSTLHLFSLRIPLPLVRDRVQPLLRAFCAQLGQLHPVRPLASPQKASLKELDAGR